MAKMADVGTLWKCETCFHHKNGGCSPEIWCENGEAYRPDRNKLVFIEAIPVIRCRDCDVPHNKWTGCPKLNGLVPPDDFYCAFGVRRDSDGKVD